MVSFVFPIDLLDRAILLHFQCQQLFETVLPYAIDNRIEDIVVVAMHR
jgi:hypothetical protein